MISRLRAVVLATGALLALGSVPLAAQEIPSPYRYVERAQAASLFAGYMATDRGRFDLGPGPQTVVGARYGVEISGPVALEGLVSMAYGPRHVVNPNREEGDRIIEEAEMRILFFEARLRFNLTGRRTWNSIQPYAYVGGGAGFDTLSDQDEDFNLEERDRYSFGTQWTGNIGGGARILLTDRWGARIDTGLRLYRVGIPEGWRDPARGFTNVPENEWVSGREITVGLSWRH
jgi:hypothetical protein